MKTVSGDDIRRALVSGDAWHLSRLVATIQPDAVRPRNDHEAHVQLHLARGIAESVPEPLRLASRAWLDKHGYGFALKVA